MEASWYGGFVAHPRGRDLVTVVAVRSSSAMFVDSRNGEPIGSIFRSALLMRSWDRHEVVDFQFG